jgi:hypothetical protein
MNYLKLKGTTLERPVIDERDGSRAGAHVEHWDDHVDARVLAKSSELVVPRGGIILPDGRRIMDRHSPLPRKIGWRSRVERFHRDERGVFFATNALYVANFIDVLDATQLAFDTSLTSHKWALYTNAIATMNPSTDVNQASAPYNANEASGTGYTTGGQIIVSPTTTESPATVMMYDMADQVWAAPTSVTARGAILYADALTNNNIFVSMNFGSDFVSTAGTFTMQFASTGVFTVDFY